MGRRRERSPLEYLPNPPRLSPVLNRVIDDMKLPPRLDSLIHLIVEMGDTVVMSITKSIRYHREKLWRSE